MEQIGDKLHVYPLSAMQCERLVFQFLLRHYLLCHSVWIGHDAEATAVTLCQATEDLCAQHLVSSIFLPILDGPTERGRKEEHLLITQDLSEVMVEITSLFLVAQDKEERRISIGCQDRGHE